MSVHTRHSSFSVNGLGRRLWDALQHPSRAGRSARSALPAPDPGKLGGRGQLALTVHFKPTPLQASIRTQNYSRSTLPKGVMLLVLGHQGSPRDPAMCMCSWGPQYRGCHHCLPRIWVLWGLLEIPWSGCTKQGLHLIDHRQPHLKKWGRA